MRRDRPGDGRRVEVARAVGGHVQRVVRRRWVGHKVLQCPVARTANPPRRSEVAVRRRELRGRAGAGRGSPRGSSARAAAPGRPAWRPSCRAAGGAGPPDPHPAIARRGPRILMVIRLRNRRGHRSRIRRTADGCGHGGGRESDCRGDCRATSTRSGASLYPAVTAAKPFLNFEPDASVRRYSGCDGRAVAVGGACGCPARLPRMSGRIDDALDLIERRCARAAGDVRRSRAVVELSRLVAPLQVAVQHQLLRGGRVSEHGRRARPCARPPA